MLKTKLTLPVATWTILTVCLSLATVACAELTIKTWFLDAGLGALIRKDKAGQIVEQRDLREADGYRCYSPRDDEAWRTAYGRYAACCNGKN